MNNFDKALPKIPNFNTFPANYSSTFESFLSNYTGTINTTGAHHPVLYGIAIYALILIIVGTIGKKYSFKKNSLKNFFSL